METKTIFTATKSEILDLLKLLARISNCYTNIDVVKKALIVRTSLDVEERDLEEVTNINKKLTSLDCDGFDAILEAEELVLLDK